MNMNNIVNSANLNKEINNNNKQNFVRADVNAQNTIKNTNVSGVQKKETEKTKKDKDYQCKTCEERVYKDDSHDSGVSFQAAGNISASNSAVTVASHENEHYTREKAHAEEEGKVVLKNDVKIFFSKCPECGKMYASGGETETVIASKKGDPDNKLNTRGVNLDVTL